MAMSGFICHDDYYDRLKRLTNEEVGNLFRQLMLYHAGRYDEMGDFIDAEGIAFDFISDDIDRMEEKQNSISETNRINGSKGGRPKKQIEQTETEENRNKPTETDTKPSGTEQKPYKDKDKEKDKDKYISSSIIADDDAHEIQSEQNRVLDAAEDAGFKMSNDVRASLISLYADNGLQKMLDGFKACVEYGVPTLAYLKGVLKGGEKKPKQGKPVKTVIAQQYEQRDYAVVQDDVEEMQRKRMAERMREMNAG